MSLGSQATQILNISGSEGPSKAAQNGSIESNGNYDPAYASSPGISPLIAQGALNPRNMPPSGSPLTGVDSDLLFKNGFNFAWSNRNSSNIDQTKVPPNNNANDTAKKHKNKNASEQQQTTNPTSASQDPKKAILDAIKGADPQNVVGAVKKALDAMITLKMIDSLTSPAGISSIASGALGQALQSLASQAGLGNMLTLMNIVSSQAQGLLGSTGSKILGDAMTGMISGTPVGILTPASMSAATSMSSTIAAAQASSSVTQIAQTAAAIGGPLLGVDPQSLAGTIAAAASGSIINKVTNVNGTNINASITVGPQLTKDIGNIPSFTGMEAVNIAQTSAASIATNLQNSITSTLGISSLSGLSSVLSNGLSGSQTPALAGAIAGALNGSISDIADQGLQSVLGSNLSGMLSNAQSLIPNIAGGLQSALNVHTPLTNLNSGTMNKVLNEATKVTGLGKMIGKISSIFGKSSSESDQAFHDQTLAAIASGSIRLPATVVNPQTGTTLSFAKA